MWRVGGVILKNGFFCRLPMRLFSFSKANIETDILTRLKEVEGVNVAKLTPACTFKEIGLDSLAQIEMYSSLEEKFKITLSDEDTDGVKGVADLVRIILSKQT